MLAFSLTGTDAAEIFYIGLPAVINGVPTTVLTRQVVGSEVVDAWQLFPGEAVELNAMGGDDQIYVYGTNTCGSLAINAGLGNDLVTADDDPHTGSTVTSVPMTVIAEGGSDTVVTGLGNDWIEGRAGNDSITASGGADSLYGGTGNDYLMGSGGNDYIHGGAGNDTMNGGSGADNLISADGEWDSVFGGTDSDTDAATVDYGLDTVAGIP